MKPSKKEVARIIRRAMEDVRGLDEFDYPNDELASILNAILEDAVDKIFVKLD